MGYEDPAERVSKRMERLAKMRLMDNEDKYKKGMEGQEEWLDTFDTLATEMGLSGEEKMREVTRYMSDLKIEARHLKERASDWEGYKKLLQARIERDIEDTPTSILTSMRDNPQKLSESVEEYNERIDKYVKRIPYKDKESRAEEIGRTYMESLSTSVGRRVMTMTGGDRNKMKELCELKAIAKEAERINRHNGGHRQGESSGGNLRGSGSKEGPSKGYSKPYINNNRYSRVNVAEE